MRNTASLLLTLAVIVSVSLSCMVGHAEKKDDRTSESGKSLKDRGVDVVVGDQKIGIPECDEVVDFSITRSTTLMTTL